MSQLFFLSLNRKCPSCFSCLWTENVPAVFPVSEQKMSQLFFLSLNRKCPSCFSCFWTENVPAVFPVSEEKMSQLNIFFALMSEMSLSFYCIRDSGLWGNKSKASHCTGVTIWVVKKRGAPALVFCWKSAGKGERGGWRGGGGGAGAVRLEQKRSESNWYMHVFWKSSIKSNWYMHVFCNSSIDWNWYSLCTYFQTQEWH